VWRIRAPAEELALNTLHAVQYAVNRLNPWHFRCPVAVRPGVAVVWGDTPRCSAGQRCTSFYRHRDCRGQCACFDHRE
jgi:hypothetical protein